MARAFIRAHYDRVSAAYSDAIGDSIEDRPWLEAFVRDLPRGAAVLDMACGPGTTTAWLARRGLSVRGLDFSEEMVRRAAGRFPAIPFAVGDMTDLREVAADSLDAIVCAYALFHLDLGECDAALSNFARALKPGGRLYLSLQHGQGAEWVPEPVDPSHRVFVQRYDEAGIAARLAAAGLEVESTDRRSFVEGEHPFDKLVIFARRPTDAARQP